MKRFLPSFETLLPVFAKIQPGDDYCAAELARAQHALVVRHISTIACISIILATSFLIAQMQFQNPAHLMIWYVISLPIPLGQLIIARRYRKRSKNGHSSQNKVSGRLLAAAERNALFYGLIWACVHVLVGGPIQESLLFTTIIQVSMCTGLAMLLSQTPRIVIPFTTVSLLPLMVNLLINGTAISVTLGLLTPVLIGAISIGCIASYEQLKRIVGSEAKTRQAESILRTTLEAMPDAFAVYSPDGDRILNNAIHDDWAIAQPQSPEGEHTFKTEHGRWLRHSWLDIPNVGTLSLHSDITTQKEREDALIEAKGAAEVANGARARFLSRMSHELRTPLNSILGFSSILSETPPNSPQDVKEYADFIQSSGQQLLGMIEDVIDYSKIGEEEDGKSYDPVDVRTAVYKAIELAKKKPGCQESKSFKIRVQEGAETVVTDGTVIERILTCIISNAIKFSPSAPDIAITSRLLRDNQLTIIIRDFGKGMTQHQIDEASSVFYQVDDSRRRAHDGAGLGLALAQKLAASIDANVKIMSEPGRGTAVLITFEDPWRSNLDRVDRLKA